MKATILRGSGLGRVRVIDIENGQLFTLASDTTGHLYIKVAIGFINITDGDEGVGFTNTEEIMDLDSYAYPIKINSVVVERIYRMY